ncbi:MAG: TAXI family TRAP transporter solute-binding subunit [Methylococcaceae bacterium]
MLKKIGSYKDKLITIGPALLLTIIAFWVASQFIKPAPPDKIVITTGREDGAYFNYAKQYKTILARNEITLEIRSSLGSSENIKRLRDGSADIAFVQGGTKVTDAGAETKLTALGSLYYEPLWLFYRNKNPLSQLTDFSDVTMAIDVEGSGTYAVASELISDNQLESNVKTLPLGGKEASQALLTGQVDAAIMISSPSSGVVQELLKNKDIALMNFQRADAYTRLHHYLSKIELAQGVIDLKNNIPPTATTLIAPTANLVVNKDFHPALVFLLLQAASEVHSQAQLFETKNEFPSPKYNEFPLSEVAGRYYKSGPPFLQRFLPFWLATLIDQMKVMLVPFIALLLPLSKAVPPLLRWRTRSRIYRWYEQLKDIDQKSYNEPDQSARQLLAVQLDEIEAEVHKVDIPLSYEDQHYNLRLHINMVRDNLGPLSASSKET